ncbi:WD repeat-containing protein 38-like [Clarias magur]|uniref:WD repeat-containing protein 38-like n=1 Tax=Clarias magur TaxID=1594786 RepID=A0A8J4TQR1_CLAMG|nr:WD repeat-containing protein 38-like [Clarias magur]
MVAKQHLFVASKKADNKPTSPEVEDEDQQVTQASAPGPGLLSTSEPDPDAAITRGEDVEKQVTQASAPGPGLLSTSEPDPDAAITRGDDVEKVQDSSLSGEPVEHGPSHTDTPTSSAQASPQTDGALRIHTVLQCSCEIMTCQFSTDGALLAVGHTDGSIKVFSTNKWRLLHTLTDRDSITNPLPITSLRFTHTMEKHSVLLATYSSGSLKCWYVSGWQRLWWVNENIEKEKVVKVNKEESGEVVERQTLCLSLSPSGENAVTGGSDSAIHLYDLTTLQTTQICTASQLRTVMDGHCSRIFAVMFHPKKEEEFISGGWDNTVQFWDTRQPNAVRMLYGPHVCGEALHIDPVTNQILSGSWRKDDHLEVWDYSSGKKVTSVPPDPQGDSLIYACQWLGRDHIIAGGCQSNAVRIIDRHSLQVTSRLFDLPSPVFSVAICPSEERPKLVAASCGDQVFILVIDQ